MKTKDKLNFGFELQDVNGNEIIDYLNLQSTEEEFEDTNVCSRSFEFETQSIKKGKELNISAPAEESIYVLHFSVDFNNWGTDQKISDNRIYITKNDVWISMDEPFDGDGTEDVIRDVLIQWLSKHQFASNNQEIYGNIISDISTKMGNLHDFTGKSEETCKDIDDIIENLKKAKSLIK